MGGDLALFGAAFAVGIGSALLPIFVNAEVFVGGLGTMVNNRLTLLLAIVSLVIATTIGKAFVFQLARKGSRKIRSVERKAARNAFVGWVRRVSDWLLGLLDRPYAGALTAFVSSLTGVPPLAIVTIMAGASRQPQWLFLTMVFAGRMIQFLAIAFLFQKVSWF
ncbi:VTT domain-containing protein [Aeromicrobium sp.]|uniref:VTT domain-containing protein n=1 Tax=Aeromicrobium sp. TaxID=1871063 RepID=UPI0019CD0726|nr:VTT domain-containing protein [Aeromicrobium sp.]MBC7632473.1 VTT domain-containing protein [Aeromicrobium sp.]